MTTHVYPAQEHATDGYDCWCQPKFYLPCDDCDHGCWKCVNGMIELTREQAEQADEALIIVHN